MTTNDSITTWGFSVRMNDVVGNKVHDGANYISLLAGFHEGGNYDSGNTPSLVCTSMLDTYQSMVPSTLQMPEDYFMSLEVNFADMCLTTSNSANMNNLQVRNAATGFR